MGYHLQISYYFFAMIFGLCISLIGSSIRMKYTELEMNKQEAFIKEAKERRRNRKNIKKRNKPIQIPENLCKKEKIKKNIGIGFFYIGSFIFSIACCYWIVETWNNVKFGVLFPAIYLFILRKDISFVFGIRKTYTDLCALLYSSLMLIAV